MDYAIKIKSYVSKEPVLIINQQLADNLNFSKKNGVS